MGKPPTGLERLVLKAFCFQAKVLLLALKKAEKKMKKQGKLSPEKEAENHAAMDKLRTSVDELQAKLKGEEWPGDEGTAVPHA